MQGQGREKSSRAVVEKFKDIVKTNAFACLAKVNKVISLKATSKDLDTCSRHLILSSFLFYFYF